MQDDILIKKAGQGDRAAFEKLVRSCADKVYNYLLRLTRGNTAAAEDILQDTFVKAYENIGSFKGESSFTNWIFRIASNTWKNRVRYEKRRKFFSHFSLSGSEENEPDIEIEDTSITPDKALESRLKKENIQQALNMLPDTARQMLILREIEELSYEEIAEMLNVSMGTVKSRIARAREQFKNILKES